MFFYFILNTAAVQNSNENSVSTSTRGVSPIMGEDHQGDQEVLFISSPGMDQP